jgi:hypothetical protein
MQLNAIDAYEQGPTAALVNDDDWYYCYDWVFTTTSPIDAGTTKLVLGFGANFSSDMSSQPNRISYKMFKSGS